MAQQDTETRSESRQGRRPQTSRKVVANNAVEDGSEFEPGLDGAFTSDDAETHELDVAMPKPKKMKLSIRKEIKAVKAKAAELGNAEEMVGF
jgi:hypothetical protein